MHSPPHTLSIRTSPTKVLLPICIICALMGVMSLSFDYMTPRARLVVWLGFSALLLAAGFAQLSVKGPRLVIAPDGLSWRAARGEALDSLPWSAIAAVRFVQPAPRERAPPCLRLILTESTALKVVSSGEEARHIDIPIDGIDRSRATLRQAIHAAASHLFAPGDRKA